MLHMSKTLSMTDGQEEGEGGGRKRILGELWEGRKELVGSG